MPNFPYETFERPAWGKELSQALQPELSVLDDKGGHEESHAGDDLKRCAKEHHQQKLFLELQNHLVAMEGSSLCEASSEQVNLTDLVSWRCIDLWFGSEVNRAWPLQPAQRMSHI